MLPGSALRRYGAQKQSRSFISAHACSMLMVALDATGLRYPSVSARGAACATAIAGHSSVLCASKRCEHTTTIVPPPEKNPTANKQVDELMDSFTEACELITDARESVGSTYFADDMEDAETQTQDVLKRWDNLQADLEQQGAVEQLQNLRNTYELKIKQLKAELETVREAGGSG
ncbi:hypothetical protein LSCM4_00153 [Leishmania orientalis]|uniref:Uncharacterized protein n=1 Tax=Leishmania orientalis TaxID=2249476 RepID=A0A836FLA3_9TRYP|nr:hypothetical protein LSCM4_00153 [Leishmania orientalis]